MANEKATIDKISALKGAAESAGKELARHEAASEHAQKRVAEVEQALTDAGLDPAQDLTAQLAAAAQAVESEMAAIQTGLEGLRS